MALKSCPCCQGEAIYADLKVGDSLMWQVSCTGCGLSSELDEDKLYTTKRWNTRRETASKRMWITTLAMVVPALSVIFFLLGTLFGVHLSD